MVKAKFNYGSFVFLLSHFYLPPKQNYACPLCASYDSWSIHNDMFLGLLSTDSS